MTRAAHSRATIIRCSTCYAYSVTLARRRSWESVHDRVDAGNYNRVADVDGSYLFGGSTAFRDSTRRATRSKTPRAQCTALARGINRNGQHLAFSYSLDGVHETSSQASGYISGPAV